MPFFFLFKNLLPKLRGDFYEPSYIYLKDFPILDIDDTSVFDSLVDRVIIQKANNNSSIDLESQIDQLVYQLYGLTDEEIKIVTGE